MTRKHFCAAAIALLLFASPCMEAVAADAGISFSHYYLEPTPQAVPDLIGTMDSVGTPMPDTADWPVGMFLAEIFAEHPEVAYELQKRRDAHSRRGRYTIALAACQAKLTGFTTFVEYMLYEDSLKPIREEMLHSEFQPLADIPVHNTTVLDALWGGFMASGKTVYVEKVIAALGYSINEQGKKGVTEVQIAARWSLASNAAQHPLVLETCRKARDAETLPADSHETLVRVIQSVEEELVENKK